MFWNSLRAITSLIPDNLQQHSTIDPKFIVIQNSVFFQLCIVADDINDTIRHFVKFRNLILFSKTNAIYKPEPQLFQRQKFGEESFFESVWTFDTEEEIVAHLREKLEALKLWKNFSFCCV